MATKKSNAIIVDTNVLIHDPECIATLCEGNNIIYVPTTVLKELDNLKNKIDIGPDVRDAIRWIEKEQLSNNKRVILVRPPTDTLISYLDLNNPDHQILATAFEIKTTLSKKFKDVKLVSRDTSVRVLGREIGLTVGDYFKDRIDEKELDKTDLPKINMSFDRIFPDFTIDILPEELFIPENGGAICFSDWDGLSEHPICPNQEWQESFVVIRKGNILKVIHKDVEMFGLKPYTINGHGVNWEQYLAIAQLMDPDIKLVFLKGGTGSGKTLLALAAAIEQRRLYRNIFITRPMIPLEDEDRMGFLPGPQPLDAKILTPDGWTTMGDIKVGDYVIGDNGKKTKVLEVYDKGIKPVYKIETTNGGKSEACGDHIWAVKNFNELKNNRDFKLRSTLEIKNSIINPRKDGPELNYTLPYMPIVEFNESAELPIPPYTLGTLLGNGCFSGSISLSSPDEDVINRVKEELKPYNLYLHKTQDIQYSISGDYYNNKPAKKVKIKDLFSTIELIYNSCHHVSTILGINQTTINSRCINNLTIDNKQYSFISSEKYRNYIKNEIFKLGLFGKKADLKFIPEVYKYSSVDHRISLLQGLMDTDGCISPTTGEQTYYTISERLRDDVIEVARSLGMNATYYISYRIGDVSIYNEMEIKTNHLCFNITIPKNDKIKVFYQKRKANLIRPSKGNHNIKINNIEYVGEKLVRCIKIDNPSSLYITNDFIITHNTMEEKMGPWVKPVWRALSFLAEDKTKNDLITKLKESGKISVEPLDYIRGMTYIKDYLIIDESQNLTPHQVKTIITRAGDYSKLVFTGDLGQVDRKKRLNSKSNGLAYASVKMNNHPLVAVSTFKKTVRSQLAHLAEEKL